MAGTLGLVGMTFVSIIPSRDLGDLGDGSFTIARQNDKWSLVFKITQSRYNLRLLYYIKRQLGVSTVTKDKTKGQILIRDRKKIAKFIIPIFDKYPLLTSKQFNYEKFKKAFYILEDSSLSREEKDNQLFYLKNKEVDPNYISPFPSGGGTETKHLYL